MIFIVGIFRPPNHISLPPKISLAPVGQGVHKIRTAGGIGVHHISRDPAGVNGVGIRVGGGGVVGRRRGRDHQVIERKILHAGRNGASIGLEKDRLGDRPAIERAANTGPGGVVNKQVGCGSQEDESVGAPDVIIVVKSVRRPAPVGIRIFPIVGIRFIAIMVIAEEHISVRVLQLDAILAIRVAQKA